MDTSDAITTQAQEDTSPPSPKNDASSVDDENEASSYKAMIERWGGDILNERGPFSNVDMKKLIQAMVKEATPSDFEDLIRPLPDYERAHTLGPKYFDESNVSFWNTVKNWERMLQSGEFNAPDPTTLEEEQELLPFKDESFLELWNCRIRLSLEKQRLKSLKLQRTKVVKYHQQKKYQRLINSFR